MNTILVVDDEKSLQYSLKRMFESEYRVFSFLSGISGHLQCSKLRYLYLINDNLL